uniref:Uncharacterized protein n=1 Tax=Timema tahoe TaxID=61484 RepID=A0A7R9IS26_9NEOP|nr:unnamed protein product [Timema tahoe]
MLRLTWNPLASRSLRNPDLSYLKHYFRHTYVKCWDKSPHVGHFRKHPKEYVTELATFLDRLGLVAYPEKIEAKLRV